MIGDTLVAAVGARKLEPGVRYKDADLAAQLGVSSKAVSVAMHDLAVEGLVDPVKDGWFQISAPTVAELREMIELRLLIEVPAVRKVADHGLNDQEQSIARRLARVTMRTAREDNVLGYIKADMAFHLYLLDLAGNRQLVDVVRILRSRSRLHGLDDSDHERFMARNAAEHAELVNLVATGDASAAGDLLRHHIARITEDWPAQ